MNSLNISKKEKSKSKIYLENIKNNFIFKKTLEYMKKNKSFEIMKYNKKLQKRLNLKLKIIKNIINL